MAHPPLAAYPHALTHQLRYGDTDRQGHINNAVYATLFEFGRTQLFFDLKPPLLIQGSEPVMVRLVIDYLSELHWPGEVIVATAVQKMGRTSMTLAQAVFGPTGCAAAGEAIIVQLDSTSRRPKPWDDSQRAAMAPFALKGG
ncbi:acyl-CoA thioesterase [Candidatus Raskinella chloraquaticus]|uniref:Uncharacterized protein n=1 Tax=Candidatus Raskinella chloraquaticus TaxID=1951219 RepID=A0A1W9I175_9HYPH|nr:MAG: hypothetical protein A4S15_05350 [Proteobacteria bacterium SG_bin8]